MSGQTLPGLTSEETHKTASDVSKVLTQLLSISMAARWCPEEGHFEVRPARDLSL